MNSIVIFDLTLMLTSAKKINSDFLTRALFTSNRLS